MDHPSPSRVALCKQSADLWTQRNVESIARRLAKVRTRLGQSEHPTANWVGNLARTLGGVANMAPGAPHHDPEAWADYVDFWVSAKQGAKILGPSWQKPGADIALAEIGEVDSRLVRDVTALLKTNPRSRVAKKWKKLPPGWTDKSVKKFWGTLTGTTPEHKVWDCIEKMTKPFGDGAGAFCGGLADWQMPGWRQKNKKESPGARSDAKSYWKKKIKKKKADMTPDPTRVAMRFAGKPGERGESSLNRKGHTLIIDCSTEIVLAVKASDGEPRRIAKEILKANDVVEKRVTQYLVSLEKESQGGGAWGVHKEIKMVSRQARGPYLNAEINTIGITMLGEMHLKVPDDRLDPRFGDQFRKLSRAWGFDPYVSL